MRQHKIDKKFLISFIILIGCGFFIFMSASLGLLARQGATFSSVAIKQILIGLVLGTAVLLAFMKLPYQLLKKHALYIAAFSLFATLLVFVPHVGFAHGGAKRWISFGPLSFQPSEFLKIGFVIYFAAWLSTVKNKMDDYRFSLIPLAVLLGLAGVVMLLQPDTGTFLVIAFSLIGIYIAAGCRFRDLGMLFLAGCLCLGLLFAVRPYIRDRFLTFLDPARDPLGAGYQIQQAQIAIGSGGALGRGFGQSVQKFNYLPEPIGDSIFAVVGEEFGFVGSTLLVLLYMFFCFQGLKIAGRSSNQFGRLLVTGIVILILSESFINIASMLGLLPLTGIPLLFVSQGGTALLFAMAEIGIVLNVSRHG